MSAGACDVDRSRKSVGLLWDTLVSTRQATLENLSAECLDLNDLCDIKGFCCSWNHVLSLRRTPKVQPFAMTMTVTRSYLALITSRWIREHLSILTFRCPRRVLRSSAQLPQQQVMSTAHSLFHLKLNCNTGSAYPIYFYHIVATMPCVSARVSMLSSSATTETSRSSLLPPPQMRRRVQHKPASIVHTDMHHNGKPCILAYPLR